MKITKAILIALSLLFVSLTMKAQITIDSSDFASENEIYLQAKDTFSTQENVNIHDIDGAPWDFTFLETDVFDTLEFIPPDATPLSDNFPASNLVQSSDDQLSFLDKSSDYVEVLGYYGTELPTGEGAVTIPFDNTLRLINFPATYNTSFTDTANAYGLTFPYSEEPGVDSVRFDLNIYTDSQVDTFGNAVTLTDTFEIIREYRRTITFVNNFEVHNDFLGTWTPLDTTQRDTSYLYNYMAKDENIPVLTVHTDKTGEISEASFKYRNFLHIDADIENVDCYNGSSGSIDPDISGGIPPYTFDWSNGETTDSIGELPAGSYSLTVTDQFGLSRDTTFTITQPDSLYAKADIVHVSDTGETDGQIRVEAQGGIPPYTYQWETEPNNDTISGLAAGTYHLTIIDANGCVANDTFRVAHQVYPLEITLHPYDVSCYGNEDGAVGVSVEGGVPPYAYSWSTGDTTASVDSLTEGWYYVTVSGDSLYSQQDSAFVSEPEPLQTEIKILSGLNDGEYAKLEGVVEGGTQPYSYLWSTGATSQILDSLSSGSYWLQVTDSNACTAADSLVLEATVLGDRMRERRIQIYPVPATDKIYVEFSQEKISHWQFKLISLDGKIIRSALLDRRKNRISLAGIPTGFYMVKVSQPDLERGKSVKIFIKGL